MNEEKIECKEWDRVNYEYVISSIKLAIEKIDKGYIEDGEEILKCLRKDLESELSDLI